MVIANLYFGRIPILFVFGKWLFSSLKRWNRNVIRFRSSYEMGTYVKMNFCPSNSRDNSGFRLKVSFLMQLWKFLCHPWHRNIVKRVFLTPCNEQIEWFSGLERSLLTLPFENPYCSTYWEQVHVYVRISSYSYVYYLLKLEPNATSWGFETLHFSVSLSVSRRPWNKIDRIKIQSFLYYRYWKQPQDRNPVWWFGS